MHSSSFLSMGISDSLNLAQCPKQPSTTTASATNGSEGGSCKKTSLEGAGVLPRPGKVQKKHDGRRRGVRRGTVERSG